MIPDKPIIGVMLMLGFCILAPAGDAVAKLLGTSVPLAQVVMIRFAVQLVILLPLVWAARKPWRLEKHLLGYVLLRTLLHISGIWAMFIALTYLPLADAVAIVFVMPFFMLILGKFVLAETVGRTRLTVCVVGFAGTLMVVQPSFSTVGWPALIPVLVAGNFAVFMLITRRIAKQTDPISLQAISGAMAVALMLPLLGAGPVLGIATLSPIIPDVTQWWLLLCIGLIGSIAHLLMTWSLRYAPSATLAPMQYLEIPFAVVLGLVIFGDLPNRLATLGIAVTIAAGLFIVLNEGASQRRLARRVSPQPAE